MKTSAVYARVSTRDKGQNPETQLLALREYAVFDCLSGPMTW
jgi:DNA invertase Pin-like site-specific DNA recombinase